MKNTILYHDFVESRLNAICTEHKSILNYSISYDEDECCLTALLTYNGFTVKLKYSESALEDYSFLESENTGKAVIAKFEFPFSDIPYSIYDIHNTVDDTVFRTYAFHSLYDEKAVGEAIDIIIDFIERNHQSISNISSSPFLQSKLADSFENGLRVASKKITMDKIKEKPEKYLSSHDMDLYFLRSGETAFVDHITKGSTRAIQKFYAAHSKAGTLLKYEERYLDMLFENDFNHTDRELVESVKKNDKVSKKLTNTTNISIFISLVLAVAVSLVIAYFTEKRMEESYFLLHELTLDSIFKIIPILIGFMMIVYEPIEYIAMKHNKDYDTSKTPMDKKIYAVIAIIGIILVAGTSTYLYYDYQKNVGLGENDIYYCQKLGKTKHLSYDEVKLYLIEGDYYGDNYSSYDEDKRIVLVKGDDYEDYFVSDYLIEMTNTYRDSLEYAGHFKSLDDFCEKFGV